MTLPGCPSSIRECPFATPGTGPNGSERPRTQIFSSAPDEPTPRAHRRRRRRSHTAHARRTSPPLPLAHPPTHPLAPRTSLPPALPRPIPPPSHAMVLGLKPKNVRRAQASPSPPSHTPHHRRHTRTHDLPLARRPIVLTLVLTLTRARRDGRGARPAAPPFPPAALPPTTPPPPPHPPFRCGARRRRC